MEKMHVLSRKICKFIIILAKGGWTHKNHRCKGGMGHMGGRPWGEAPEVEDRVIRSFPTAPSESRPFYTHE